ncbi:MAG: hypothetical protein PHD07_06995 [Bacteroidales bacterium]|nr:hypothetical protein [Bacteroidales bacterium]
MKQYLVSLLLLLPILTSCNKEKFVKGVITDASMNTIVIMTDAGKTLTFSTIDATKIAMNGILTADTATVFYTGYRIGTNTDKCTVTKVIVFPGPREDQTDCDQANDESEGNNTPGW